jgi:MoaA/NifB/PqqE/SkfB family radical SAM enzyme
MHPDLPFAIEEARRLGYGSVTVDTNGYLFNNILEKTSPDLVDFFSFSLDGSRPEVNDPIRGEGSFDACTEGIKRAVKLGFNASSIFTAHRMNLHDLENMPELLASLGVRRFFIQVIGIRGNPAMNHDESLQLGRKEWEAVVPDVARKAASLGMRVTYPAVFLERDERFECAGVVADNYFVFPNGRVYTCPLCEDLDLHAFEIREGRLVKRPPVTEADLYTLSIDEGCVMNRILHPGNIEYENGRPLNRIACCMLKKEL